MLWQRSYYTCIHCSSIITNSKFSRYSEEFASEFLENLKNISSILYNTASDLQLHNSVLPVKPHQIVISVYKNKSINTFFQCNILNHIHTSILNMCELCMGASDWSLCVSLCYEPIDWYLSSISWFALSNLFWFLVF